MPKVQDTMSLHESAVQRLAASEVEIPVPRPRRQEREHPVDTSVETRRKSDRAADKLFRYVRKDVYAKALEIADGNWRRLEVVDNETIIVKNNEVH
jgi:hypothetical protein